MATLLCTNHNCPGRKDHPRTKGVSHWKGFGKPSGKKCTYCGNEMREIEGEPRGMPHSR